MTKKSITRKFDWIFENFTKASAAIVAFAFIVSYTHELGLFLAFDTVWLKFYTFQDYLNAVVPWIIALIIYAIFFVPLVTTELRKLIGELQAAKIDAKGVNAPSKKLYGLSAITGLNAFFGGALVPAIIVVVVSYLNSGFEMIVLSCVPLLIAISAYIIIRVHIVGTIGYETAVVTFLTILAMAMAFTLGLWQHDLLLSKLKSHDEVHLKEKDVEQPYKGLVIQSLERGLVFLKSDQTILFIPNDGLEYIRASKKDNNVVQTICPILPVSKCPQRIPQKIVDEKPTVPIYAN